MPDYPTTNYAKYELSSIQPTLVNESVNGQDAERYNGGHKWIISIVHPKMDKEGFSEIIGFINYVDSYKSFTVKIPDRLVPRGVGTGTPLVNNGSGYAKDSDSIATDGWTASQTGILKSGDLLKFSGHDYVYIITADTNSDGSGNATLSIEPPLKSAVSDNESITVNNVTFTVMKRGKPRYRYSPPYIYDFSLEVETIG